ncbi:MAG: 30S ribosomal protein S8 [Candidatus Omnitrophica bacterium]|nr:30S ribosomal protein S8 [Candidatus Omnitrophota bacterium]
MSRTDMIADGFTMIRNAIRARKEDVAVPHSRMLLRVLEILKEKKFIENFKELDTPEHKQIKVYLRYEGKKNAIHSLQRVSTPGRRVYNKRKAMARVLSGYGVAIISTSQGVVTDEKARELGVGGEVIGYVW